ncbi:MAG: phage/plasmid primase, P4 family [Syntrophorhabdales bacterium]|jgi:putative DNA primase/helicase
MQTMSSGVTVTPQSLLNAGFSILPCKEDKSPAVPSWTPYQTERMTEAECSRMFSNGAQIGVIGGTVSGNLECVDFDDPTVYGPFLDLLDMRRPGLRGKLTLHERTPRGGYHIAYRAEGPVAGNTKLAMKPDKDEQGRDTWKVRIETRGEGGYFVAAPSKGYEFLSGNLLDCPVLSAGEVQAIHETARVFDLKKPTEQRQTERREARTRSDGPSPGDRYNQDHDIDDILKSYGWRPARRTTAGEGWTRPGKAEGISGVLMDKTGVFYVFSSNAYPLEAERSYGAFGLYAMYEHDGDFSAAAQALLREKGPNQGSQDTVVDEKQNPGSAEDALPVAEDEESAPDQLPSTDILDALGANEDGDARLLVMLHRGRFLYDHAAGRWYTWSKNHWREDLIEEVTRAVDAVVDIYGHEAKRQAWERLKCEKAGRTDEARKHAATEEALFKRIRLLQTTARRGNVLALARAGRDRLGITGQEWDLDGWLLPCSNGVVDLHSGEMREGRPQDYMKTIAPTPWTGIETPAPTWEKFLADVFDGNDEIVSFLWRFLGYSVTGLTTFHALPILWGIGRNGKSTFAETLGHVLGSLAGPIEAEMLLTQRGQRQSGGPTSDLMSLRGKRLVWASETSEGRRLNPAKLKLLTGGDTLTGREVFGRHQVNFRPTHKLFLLTNSKPHAPAGDFALWARLHLIPFTLSFVDEPHAPHERRADPDLPEKLKAEASGILAWLVRGCLTWQREGLKPPKAVRAATEAYRGEEDTIAQFIADVCETGAAMWTGMKTLYEAYTKWAEASGVASVTLMRLSRELVDRGFERDAAGRTVIFRGIGIREVVLDE